MNRPSRKTRLACALVGLALSAGTASAGERQGTELAFGYSLASIDDVTRHGAHATLAFDLFGPVSGFVDGSVHWGSSEGVGLSDATLMAGPGMRFGRRAGTAFFVRAMAGLVRDRATISVLDVDISESATRFAALAGGGVERRITRSLAIQVTGDYLWTDVDEGESSGFRVTAGLAYRFGVPR